MWQRKSAFFVLLFAAILLGATDNQKPTEEIPFKIDAIGDWSHEFTPSATGRVEAYVRLDQRECYIHVVLRSPTGRSMNSHRLGYSIFKTTLSIPSDETGKPWKVRIKNFCELKPISGVLKLYYPHDATSDSAFPSVPASVAGLPRTSDSQGAGALPPDQKTTSAPEIRLNGKTRSAVATLPGLKDASVEFDGVRLSPDPAHQKREEEGWILLGGSDHASVSLTLTFASEAWIAIFVDFSTDASAPVQFSSAISPALDSAVVLAPQSETISGDARFPVWVKGLSGAKVQLTFSASNIWVRGILIQPGIPTPSIPE